MKKYKILLNNKMYESKEWVNIHSPETNEIVGCVPALTSDEIDGIFKNAKIEFKKWSSLNQKIRIEYIKNFANILLENKNKLAKIMTQEIAKPFNDGVREVERSYEYILETIDEYKKSFLNPKKIENDNKIAFLERVPLGVVVAISPFNYPINLSISKIIPALILGNTVVFKPATQGSISGALLSSLFKKINMPKNVFNIVTGKGSEIGDKIISNKNANMISFTGGVNVGKKILKENIQIPKVLELGGKDPAIILEDANIKNTAKEIVNGALSFSGQRCTAIKIVFVHKNISKKIIEEIKINTSKIKIGKAIDNNKITSLINSSSLKWANELIKDAKEKGGVIILGDKIENNILYPTIITNINDKMLIFDEEQFSPIIPIMEYSDINKVIKHVNNSQFGLQASIFTKNIKKFNEIANEINYGTVNLNKSPSRSPDTFPFSGIKNSGFGVQGIYWSLESMSRIKLIIKK